MNKIKWLFAMMMVVAMFAMTACDTLPADGGKDDDNAPSAKTIGEINYKPADTDAVEYIGFIPNAEKGVGLAGIAFADTTTTHDDVVQSVVAQIKTTTGVKNAELVSYTADTTRPAGVTKDDIKTFDLTVKLTANEGYQFADKKNTLDYKLQLDIGKLPETKLATIDINTTIMDMFNPEKATLLHFKRALLDGVPIDHAYPGMGFHLLSMAICSKSDAEDFADSVRFLLEMGASTDGRHLGYTVVILAVNNSAVEILEDLILAGADVNGFAETTDPENGYSALDFVYIRHVNGVKANETIEKIFTILKKYSATASPKTDEFMSIFEDKTMNYTIAPPMGVNTATYSKENKEITLDIMSVTLNFKLAYIDLKKKQILLYAENPDTFVGTDYSGLEVIDDTTGKLYIGKAGMGDTVTPRDKVFVNVGKEKTDPDWDDEGLKGYAYTIVTK